MIPLMTTLSFYSRSQCFKGIVLHQLDKLGLSFILEDTVNPASYEFGWSKHPLTSNRFLCSKITDSSAERFAYNKDPSYSLSRNYKHCWTIS